MNTQKKAEVQVLKRWKDVKTLDTYEDANALREELLASDKTMKLKVKVKRCGDGGSQFKVKSWYPPKNKTNKAKKAKGKGKRNER
jgi:hypothetical protein